MNRKKNILLIWLDGMRADRLGCCGYERNTSPCIDSLARNSIICKNHYSVSNCSLPAYFSMFTGLYPVLHKATPTFGYYDGAYPFLTDILKEEGFTTFGISNAVTAFSREWGFIRGYDKYYRIGKVENWFKESKEKQRGLINSPKQKLTKKIKSQWHSFLIKNKIAKSEEQKFIKDSINYYSNNDMGGQRAIEAFEFAMEEIQGNSRFPFFGYINIPDTHHPYIPPLKTQNIFGTPNITRNILMLNLRPIQFEKEDLELSSQEIYDLNLLYDSTVRYVDYLVEQIVEILKRKSLFDDTVIIFAGDHGGMLFEKRGYLGSTCYTYEPEIHIPFIVVNSNYVSSIISDLTSAIDVFPTILDIAGLSFSWNSLYKCKSIFSKEKGHKYIIIDYPKWSDWLLNYNKDASIKFVSKYNLINRTLKTDDGWKFIWRNDGAHELYCITEDPEENNNLFKINIQKSCELIDLMQKIYTEQIGEMGKYLEIYVFNDVGDELSNIPALEIINPDQDEKSIVDLERFVVK